MSEQERDEDKERMRTQNIRAGPVEEGRQRGGERWERGD